MRECKEHDIEYFEAKLLEIEEYFKERAKKGWPSIKTEHDLNVECVMQPFANACINYLKGELDLQSMIAK